MAAITTSMCMALGVHTWTQSGLHTSIISR